MRGQRASMLRDLADVAERLADDELDVLVTIAARAWAGQARYGRLDLRRDGRDLQREALEELCDGAFYLGAALVRRRVRARASGRPPTTKRWTRG